jgi:hypothetical protein
MGQQEHRFAEALIAEGAGPPEPPLHEVIDGLGFGGIHGSVPPEAVR